MSAEFYRTPRSLSDDERFTSIRQQIISWIHYIEEYMPSGREIPIATGSEARYFSDSTGDIVDFDVITESSCILRTSDANVSIEQPVGTAVVFDDNTPAVLEPGVFRIVLLTQNHGIGLFPLSDDYETPSTMCQTVGENALEVKLRTRKALALSKHIRQHTIGVSEVLTAYNTFLTSRGLNAHVMSALPGWTPFTPAGSEANYHPEQWHNLVIGTAAQWDANLKVLCRHLYSIMFDVAFLERFRR